MLSSTLFPQPAQSPTDQDTRQGDEHYPIHTRFFIISIATGHFSHQVGIRYQPPG